MAALSPMDRSNKRRRQKKLMANYALAFQNQCFTGGCRVAVLIDFAILL